jgi:hypothetical protein
LSLTTSKLANKNTFLYQLTSSAQAVSAAAAITARTSVLVPDDAFAYTQLVQSGGPNNPWLP